LAVIQEIGITIDLSRGTFVNTLYANGSLQLMESNVKDGDNNTIFNSYGYWESDDILIQDKIQSFKNVVKTIVVKGNATINIFVKTSNDGLTYGEYILVAVDGSISNAPAKYAKIKIEFVPEKIDANFYIDKFNDENKYNNDLINDTQGVLELKKKYNFPMDTVNSVAEGTIYAKTIPKSQLKKIDFIKFV
jgi:hypothetical protein